MRSLVAFLSLLLVGCTTARGRAIEAATAAEARGDTLGAPRAWAEACSLEPEDCPRAAQAREAAVVEAVEAASPACGAGEAGACTAALRQVRALAPDDGRVLALVEAAVRPAARSLLDAALLERARQRVADCPAADALDDAGLRCRAEVLRFSGLPADGGGLLAALAGGPVACRAAVRATSLDPAP